MNNQSDPISQTHLNAILRKERLEHEQRLEAEKQKLEAEKQELAGQLGKRNEELANLRQKHLEDRKVRAISEAANKAHFIDVSDVVKLTKDDVTYDAALDTFVVLNQYGTPRVDSSLRPMSLEAYYLELAEEKKTWCHADAKYYSTPSQKHAEPQATGWEAVPLDRLFGKKADGGQTIRLKKENPELYRRLRQKAQELDLIPR